MIFITIPHRDKFQFSGVRWWNALPTKKTCSTHAKSDEIYQDCLTILKQHALYFALIVTLVTLLT